MADEAADGGAMRAADFLLNVDVAERPLRGPWWKNKIAGGFTNSGSQSGDKLNSLTDLAVFAMQHAMIWVGLDLLPGNNHSKGSVGDLNRLGAFLGAMAQSNVDEGPDLAPPTADRDTAEHYGRRVAEVAKIWARGRNTQP